MNTLLGDFPRSWRDVVLAALVLATFVALCFSPAATCSLRISDGEPTTTTVPTNGSSAPPE